MVQLRHARTLNPATIFPCLHLGDIERPLVNFILIQQKVRQATVACLKQRTMLVKQNFNCKSNWLLADKHTHIDATQCQERAYMNNGVYRLHTKIHKRLPRATRLTRSRYLREWEVSSIYIWPTHTDKDIRASHWSSLTHGAIYDDTRARVILI